MLMVAGEILKHSNKVFKYRCQRLGIYHEFVRRVFTMGQHAKSICISQPIDSISAFEDLSFQVRQFHARSMHAWTC